MPTALTGFTRSEIIANTMNSMGNPSSRLRQQMESEFTSWAYEFYNLHKWGFLYKDGRRDTIKFATVATQSYYTLNTATCGAEFESGRVEALYITSATKARQLTKRTPEEIKNVDPGLSQTGDPILWAPISPSSVLLWPTPTSIEDVYIDGYHNGGEVNTDIALPIPYKYQALFRLWIFTKALNVDRDPREGEELKKFMVLLRSAISADMSDVESNLRFKTASEADRGGTMSADSLVFWGD